MMDLAHDKTGLEKDSGQIESNVWYNSRGGEWDGCRHQDGHDHQVTNPSRNDSKLRMMKACQVETSVTYKPQSSMSTTYEFDTPDSASGQQSTDLRGNEVIRVGGKRRPSLTAVDFFKPAISGFQVGSFQDAASAAPAT